MELPESFLLRMRGLLGERFDEFLACYDRPNERGLRINTLKLPLDGSGALSALLGLPLEPVPFAREGFRVTDPDAHPGLSPWHHAGAYYMQEPAAMSAVTALDPQPGERVLDMCAAPGGKTTQTAARMGNTGLLWANEYVRSRTQPLLSNIERLGLRNTVVSSLHPDRIADALEGCFDRVLVDAPCSGEGMFRRDPVAISEWSPEHVRTCAARQAGILDSAARCVAEGGVLVYSTCTFAPEENEQTVVSFLERHEDFYIEPIAEQFGSSGLSVDDRYDTTLARRIYPMDGGEGHFVVRMRRRGDASSVSRRGTAAAPSPPPADVLKQTMALFEECFTGLPDNIADRLTIAGDQLFLLPEGWFGSGGLPVVRGGVHVGTVKRSGRSCRIEPAHALFCAMQPRQCRNIRNLEPDSPLLSAFLRGEQLDVEGQQNGWCAVACGGVICGFGKCTDGALKNKYPKGLRHG